LDNRHYTCALEFDDVEGEMKYMDYGVKD